jgi:hypothetical protein
MTTLKVLLKKWYPSLIHIAATGILFADASVRNYTASNPGKGAAVLAVWGVLLHWAASPRSA